MERRRWQYTKRKRNKCRRLKRKSTEAPITRYFFSFHYAVVFWFLLPLGNADYLAALFIFSCYSRFVLSFQIATKTQRLKEARRDSYEL